MTKSDDEISHFAQRLNSLLGGECDLLNSWTDEELRTLCHYCLDRTPGEAAVRILSRYLLQNIGQAILEERHAEDPPR